MDEESDRSSLNGFFLLGKTIVLVKTQLFRLCEGGFHLVIYPNDYSPSHVHVFKAEGLSS